MNWDQIAGNWKELSGKARQQWGKLTDDDLSVINGQREELIGRIQAQYGVTREEAERQVSDWERSLNGV
ncbi:MAG: CsbD family protein [Geminicoccaceae bacterium]